MQLGCDADSFIQIFSRGTTPERVRVFQLDTKRQLLAFCWGTVASQPKILILDEATANIDSEQKVWFKLRSQGETGTDKY